MSRTLTASVGALVSAYADATRTHLLRTWPLSSRGVIRSRNLVQCRHVSSSRWCLGRSLQHGCRRRIGRSKCCSRLGNLRFVQSRSMQTQTAVVVLFVHCAVTVGRRTDVSVIPRSCPGCAGHCYRDCQTVDACGCVWLTVVALVGLRHRAVDYTLLASQHMGHRCCNPGRFVAILAGCAVRTEHLRFQICWLGQRRVAATFVYVAAKFSTGGFGIAMSPRLSQVDDLVAPTVGFVPTTNIALRALGTQPNMPQGIDLMQSARTLSVTNNGESLSVFVSYRTPRWVATGVTRQTLSGVAAAGAQFLLQPFSQRSRPFRLTVYHQQNRMLPSQRRASWGAGIADVALNGFPAPTAAVTTLVRWLSIDRTEMCISPLMQVLRPPPTAHSTLVAGT